MIMKGSRRRVCQEQPASASRLLTAFYSFWQTPFIHVPQFSIHLRPVADWHRPFFCGPKSCQVRGFQQGCITGEYVPPAAGFILPDNNNF